MTAQARPYPLDVSEKSQQEQADEEFVNGVLGLSLETSRRFSRSKREVASKYGSLTSPTGEFPDTRYIRTSFGALSRLPHQAATTSGSQNPTTATAGVSLLENTRRGRARIQHHHHQHNQHNQQQQQQQHDHHQRAADSQREVEERREHGLWRGEPVERPTESLLPSETGSVASFGTSISHASTRVIKEPMRPSWMPLRVGKSIGTRRVQGAGLLHVSGRAGKQGVDTSLRDKYETPRPIVPPQRRTGSRRASLGRADGPSSIASTAVSSSAATLAPAKLGGVDNAKELRRIFKLHLHTLPAIEGVKGLTDGFETAALFRKPSKLTEDERKRIFAKLATLREEAVRQEGQEGRTQRPPADNAPEERDDGHDGHDTRGIVCEGIQSRLDRLSALAAHAQRAGFG